MNSGEYRFRVGDFECVVILDGTNAYHHPDQVFFPNAEESALRGELQRIGINEDPWTEYESPYPSLVVFTRDNVILIDTGAGGFSPTNGKLQANLQSADIAAEDIGTVILTHGHLDHIGGNVNERDVPCFPNARYVIADTEWNFWYPEPDMSRWKIAEFREVLIQGAQKNLNSLADIIDTVPFGTEIEPGIRAMDASGHTPGQMAVFIESEGESLLHLSDAALLPVHISRTDWYSLVDMDTTTALESRLRLLNIAATKGSKVFGSHFPYPGLGTVSKKDDTFEWSPVIIPSL